MLHVVTHERTQFTALSEEGSSSDSEYSSSSYRRLSAVVEEESSTEAFSDKPPREFLREMIVTTQYVDNGKKITFKSGDAVEVLDTAKSDRWLVRSKKDSLQVGYIPKSCLGESAVRTETSKAKSLNAGGGTADEAEAEDEDDLKSGTRKRDEKQQKTQGSRKAAENGGNSSEDDASSPDADVYPTFVAIADYESDELKVREGQFLEVIDKSNPISWLVRTKPTKNNASRIGMMPASYLEVKDGVGHVDRRSTREVFREDIIQITDKQTEASVKRRYALAELLESEHDYIVDLENLIEKLRADQTTPLPEKDRVLEELVEFLSFHKESFLPDLEQCAGVPADVADAFLSWKTGRPVPDAARLPQCFETPLAHIRKYQTLLKDFIRYTARSGGDCEKLEKALNLLLYVTKCIDDQDVLQKLKDCPTEVLAQKPLLRHESVIVSYSDDDTIKGKERHLFLFPESLVVTRLLKTASQSEEYQFKESLELKNIRLNDSVSSDDKKFELFYVTDEGRNDMFVVQTKNDFSKEAWLRDLENMLRAQGVEKCYVTEEERTEILKKKEASESTLSITKQSDSTSSASASKDAVAASGKQSAALDYSTGTETEQYMTAAESEVSSSYCTAQESADDSHDSGDSGSVTPRTLDVPQAPFFVEQLTPIVPDDGTFAKFECAIGGYPLPNVSWYFQGEAIIEDGHYTMSVNNQQCTMIIHDLTVEDAGLYVIEATNAHGKVSCKAELKVDPPAFTSNFATAASDAAAAADSIAINPTDAAALTAKDGSVIDAPTALDSLEKSDGASTTNTGAGGSADSQQSAEECDREGDRPKMSASQALGSEESTFNQPPAGPLLPDKESVGSTSTNRDGEQDDEKEMNDEEGSSEEEETEKSEEDEEVKKREQKESDEISQKKVEVQRSAVAPVLTAEDQQGSPASVRSSVGEATGTAMSRESKREGSSAVGTDSNESNVATSSSSAQLGEPTPDSASAAAICAAPPADAVDSAFSNTRADETATSIEQRDQDELADYCKSPVLITVSAEDRGDERDSPPTVVGIADITDEEDRTRVVDADVESREQEFIEQGKPVGTAAESCAGEDDGQSPPASLHTFSHAAPFVDSDGGESRPTSKHPLSLPSGEEVDDETLRRRTSPSDQTRHYYSRANADASIEIPRVHHDDNTDDACGIVVGGRGHKRDGYDSRRSGAGQRSRDEEPADAVRRPRRAATAEPISRGDRLGDFARQGQRGSSHGPGIQESRITRSHSPEIQSPTLAFPLNKLPPSVRLRLSTEAAYQSTVALPSAQHFSWHKQTAPPSPISEKPEIKQAGADQFVLFWLPPESHKDKELNISYIVEYRTAADSDWRRLGRSIRESFVKLDLPIRQTQYRIRAENEYGCSDPSLFVSGPWKKPKEVDYGFEVTVPSYIAVPPSASLSRIRSVVRRARARSCDRLTAGRSTGSAEWLLNVSHHQQQQQSAITVTDRRSRSSEREGSYSIFSAHSPTPSSESHHLSRRGQASLLPTTLRRRLCDLEQEMTSDVESILDESCFRVTTAARSRFERYRSRSECRQTTSLAAYPGRATAWDDDSTLTLFGNRASSQKRLVMPSAVQRRLGSELRDQATLSESATYGLLRNHDPSNSGRLEPSYLSSYNRESDYEYTDIGRLGIQRSRAAYQADKWTRHYHSSPDSTGRASPSSLRSSVGASGHGFLSPPATSDLFEMRSSRHGSRDDYDLSSPIAHGDAAVSSNGNDSLADEISLIEGAENFYWTGGMLADRSASLEGDSGSDISIRSAPDEDFALAPRFAKNRDADDQYAIEGRTARVVCTVYTHSRSTISWYKDDAKVLVGDGERYNSLVYPSGLCLLQFDDMKWEDAGTYEVVVKNDYGTASRRIRLKVADPPTFLELPPLSMKLHRFDSLKIACKVDGIPAPRVWFFKDAQKIACSPRVQIEVSSSGTCWLSVRNALLRDAGLYTVVAENVAGQNRFSVLVDIDEKYVGPQMDQTSGYFFEDHYYVQEEIDRDSNCTVNRVIEKSSGLEFYAYTYRDLSSPARQRYWRQLGVARAVSSSAVVNIINVIENDCQFVVVTEMTGMKFSDHMLLMPSWSENLVAYYIQQLVAVSDVLNQAGIALVSLQLDNIYVSSISHKLKLDVYEAGWRLTSSTGRSEYRGVQSMFSAPEAVAGEACNVTGMWNVGVITYLLLGGVPDMQDDCTINVDVDSLTAVSHDARDLITRLLQRETRERLTTSEALRHPWLRRATPEDLGIKLDLSRVQEFIVVHQEQRSLLPRHLRRRAQLSHSPRLIDAAAAGAAAVQLTPHEEAWLTDWFSDYRLPSGDDSYAVPVHELSLPLTLRSPSSSHADEEMHENEEAMWCVRTLHLRDRLESVGGSRVNILPALKLTKGDLISLAVVGMAHLEYERALERAPQKTGDKTPIHFSEKLEPLAFQFGRPFALRCRLDYSNVENGRNAVISWYKNGEAISSDVGCGATMTCDQYELRHCHSGHIVLRLRRAATSHDAGVYKCVARLEQTSTSTCCWVQAGDVPSRPGRPTTGRVGDGPAVLLTWAEPRRDNSGYIRSYRVDCKAEGEEKWTAVAFTYLCSTILTDLRQDVAYRFRVSAINQFGYSPYSVATSEFRVDSAGCSTTVHLSSEETSLIIENQRRPAASTATDHSDDSTATDHSDDFSCFSQPYPSDRERQTSCRSDEEVFRISTANPKQIYKFTDEATVRGLHKCRRLDDRRRFAAYRLLDRASDETLESLDHLGRRLGRHPHIFNLLEAYSLPNSLQALLIYDCTSADTLLQRLVQRKSYYSESLVRDIMLQVANAVEYLHDRGVVHADVQPENLVMADDYGWRVLLAGCDRARPAASAGRPSAGRVQAGQLLEFLAPEATCGEPLTSATDVWGLGIIAFVLLCGRSPFYSTNQQDVLERIRCVRYWTGDQPAQGSLLQAHTFLFQTLKRLPENRLSVAEAANHPWLMSGPSKATPEAPAATSNGGRMTVATAVTWPAVEFSTRRLRPLAARLREASDRWQAPSSGVVGAAAAEAAAASIAAAATFA